MNRLREIFRAILAELRVPEDFGSDWYGYATNQLSHCMLGILAACLLSGLHFWTFGEFAEKGALFFVIAIGYAIWEVGVQPWRGIDTVEDWVFFTVYGAGSMILFFNETQPGSPVLTTSMEWVMPFIAIVVGHLVAGVVARICVKVMRK